MVWGLGFRVKGGLGFRGKGGLGFRGKGGLGFRVKPTATSLRQQQLDDAVARS